MIRSPNAIRLPAMSPHIKLLFQCITPDNLLRWMKTRWYPISGIENTSSFTAITCPFLYFVILKISQKCKKSLANLRGMVIYRMLPSEITNKQDA